MQTKAQSSGNWNQVRPTNCFVYGYSQNGQVIDNLQVYTSNYSLVLTDTAAIHAALYPCYTGAPFWAYYFGGNNWSQWIWIETGQR